MYHWSTSAFDRRWRHEAWAEALTGSHLPWALGAPPRRDFEAKIASRGTDGFSVVNCRCDPCSGERGRWQIGQADDAMYGILVLRAGRELVRQPAFEAQLSPGDMIIWDASQPCAFEVSESIAKTTIFISRERLRAAISCDTLTTGLVDTHSGMGALVRDRMLALDAVLGDLDDPALIRLAHSLVDEIAHLARPEGQSLMPPRRALMARVERAIDARLGDPELTPSALAAQVGISLRYLHWLFRDEEKTVCERLLYQRLEAVARDLRDPAINGASVTQIAFARGFSSSSHLSRSFRKRFGCSPTEYRAARRGLSNAGLQREPADGA